MEALEYTTLRNSRSQKFAVFHLRLLFAERKAFMIHVASSVTLTLPNLSSKQILFKQDHLGYHWFVSCRQTTPFTPSFWFWSRKPLPVCQMITLVKCHCSTSTKKGAMPQLQYVLLLCILYNNTDLRPELHYQSPYSILLDRDEKKKTFMREHSRWNFEHNFGVFGVKASNTNKVDISTPPVVLKTWKEGRIWDYR